MYPYRIEVGGNGVGYMRVAGLKIAVIIPSKRRTHLVRDHPMLPVATISVGADELEDYRAALGPKARIVTHNGRGLCQAMNRMIENGFSEPDVDCLMRFDDDFIGLRYLFSSGARFHVIRDIDQIMAAMVALARMCKDGGIGMFGFNLSAQPVGRTALSPYRLRHWVMGRAAGFCDSRLRAFEDALTSDDVQLSLDAIEKTEMLLTDQRYWVVTKTEGQGRDAGGAADGRSVERHNRDLEAMADRYPGVVVPLWGELQGNGLTRLKVTVPK